MKLILLCCVSLVSLSCSHLHYAALVPSDAERAALWGADSPSTVVHVWAARRGGKVRGVAFAHTHKITWRRLWPLIQPAGRLVRRMHRSGAAPRRWRGAMAASQLDDGAQGVHVFRQQCGVGVPALGHRRRWRGSRTCRGDALRNGPCVNVRDGIYTHV